MASGVGAAPPLKISGGKCQEGLPFGAGELVQLRRGLGHLNPHHLHVMARGAAD